MFPPGNVCFLLMMSRVRPLHSCPRYVTRYIRTRSYEEQQQRESQCTSHQWFVLMSSKNPSAVLHVVSISFLYEAVNPAAVVHNSLHGYQSRDSMKRPILTSFPPRREKEIAPSARLPIWPSAFPLISHSDTSTAALIWDTPVSYWKENLGASLRTYLLLCVMSHTGQVRVETLEVSGAQLTLTQHLL